MKLKLLLFIGGAVLAGIAVYKILKKNDDEPNVESESEGLDKKVAEWGVGS